MVDWVKRINKAAGDELVAGEDVVAGVLLQPPGAGKRVAGGAIGGLIGAAVAAKLTKKDDDGTLVSDQGIAAGIPQGGPLVFGLTTGGKVLIYSQASMSGKPKELQATLTKQDVASVEVGKGSVTKPVTMMFRDGTGRRFETPGIDKSIESFAAQFG